MLYENMENYDKRFYENLKNACSKCFGLCCVALYFSATEGFPTNKEAGRPCPNLNMDFSCVIHNSLAERGLKGCTAYDCFGAGQKVAQSTYNGEDWLKSPGVSKKMFEVFSIMRQLHEMLWYLTGALLMKTNTDIQNNLENLIVETEGLTYLNRNDIIDIDIDSHRDKVNSILKKVIEVVQTRFPRNQNNIINSKKSRYGRLDLIGKDLRRINLKGLDLAGALLVAADFRGNDLTGTNLIGADLRNADIRGANLSESVFITQSQINTAKGDSYTRVPLWIDSPKHWRK